MSRPVLSLAACAALALTGCITVVDNELQPIGDPSVPGGPVGQCSDAGLGGYVGRTATQELGTELARVSGARLVRWARPDEAMTMEFREDRLTVRIDAANRILGFTCG